jgi:hypothetical protein
MCPHVTKILIRKSKAETKKSRSYFFVYAVSTSGRRIKFACYKDLTNGQWSNLSTWQREPFADWPVEVQNFVRNVLLAPKQKKPKVGKSTIGKKAEHARKRLEQWQRKLKLAQTKVKKYKKQVSYYEKKEPHAEFSHLLKQVPAVNLS